MDARSDNERLYASAFGDRLIDSSLFPIGITDFLAAELKLLNSVRHAVELLVEVGSMYGRHLDWAIRHAKAYTGIDPIDRYVVTGQRYVQSRALDPRRYRFILGEAENLADVVLGPEQIASKRTLLFFPFNSIGNMAELKRIVMALKAVRRPFLVSSYLTTDEATTIRAQYYQNCGYRGLCQQGDCFGVRFVAEEGLRTCAYHPEYISNLFATHGMEVQTIPLSRIGIAYAMFKH